MDLATDARVKSVFVFDDVVPPQQLELFGIVKSARMWRQPTYQTRPIDISQSDASSPRWRSRACPSLQILLSSGSTSLSSYCHRNSASQASAE